MSEAETKQLQVRNKEEIVQSKRWNKRETNGTARNQVSKGNLLPEEGI